MDRPPIDAQVLGRAVDGAAAGGQQHHDELADVGAGGASARRRLGVEELPREARELGIGVRVGRLEVAARAHDAVEVVAELDVAAEDALVDRAVGRRVVREAHAARPPVRSEQCAQHPERDADRELRRLAHGARAPDHELLAQHHDVARVLDGQVKLFVDVPAVGDQRLDRAPHGGLLAQEEAQRTEVRQAARLRHQEPEPLDAASLRGRLEKRAHLVDGHRELGVLEAARRQPELAQHARGIEPDLARDLRVVREARASYDARTGRSACPERTSLCHARSIRQRPVTRTMRSVPRPPHARETLKTWPFTTSRTTSSPTGPRRAAMRGRCSRSCSR